MLYSDEPVLSTIEAIYRASTDPSQWSAALGEFANLVGACAMTLLHRNLTDGGIVFAASGMDPHLIELYDEYYWAHDVTLKASEALPVGTFASSDVICTTAEYGRNEMVADLLIPNAFYRVGGSVLVRSEQAFASLGLHRPKSAPEFDDIEALYLDVQPHLQRALAINQKLRLVAAEREALAHSLDRIATGVAVLNSSGEIIHANRAASEIAAANDGFALTRSGLAGASSSETALVRQRIAEAAKTATGVDTAGGGVVLLERPSGKRPYEVLATPLKDPDALGGDHRGCVVVFISDPEREAAPPTEWLQHLYGFTAAEATLVLTLANGTNLSETAEQLGVSRNTARTHLQRALAKTDTNRQGELIRLVLSGPAGIVMNSNG